jgi:hypothetical protein
MPVLRPHFIKTKAPVALIANRVQRALAVCVLAGLMLQCGIAAAQNGAWIAPSSGYVYDTSNKAIRPVNGFIGSASLGQPVAEGIDWVSMAPNQTSALAGQNGSTVWIPDLSMASSSRTVDRIPSVRQIFWAADATRAVVLTEGSQLVWMTDFSSGPTVLSSWNLLSYGQAVPDTSQSSAPSGRIRAPRTQGVWSLLAVDSKANQVLLALRTGDNRELWTASSTSPPVNVPFSGQPVAAAFAAGTGGVLVADAAGHQIVQIQNLATVPVAAAVLASDAYVNDPGALAMSSDGNRLFIADKTDQIVRVFASNKGKSGIIAPVTPMAELPTSSIPNSLTMFAPDRYLLNAPGNPGQLAGQSQDQSAAPLFFLDTGVSPRVSFVPRGE